MYFRKMTGEKCYLSPICPDDAEKYTLWLNDSEITDNLTLASVMITLEGEREALRELAKEHNYAIIDNETNELIGNIGLMNISHLHRTAEIGLFIGNKSYWNKGYGKESLGLLIDFAFNKLNLHNIILRVYSFNTNAIKCYESVGFKKIGEQRESVTINRKTYNTIFMDIIPDDFYNNK